MMLVLQYQRFSSIFFYMGQPYSASFQLFLMSSTHTERNNPCFRWANKHSQLGTFSPIRFPIGLPQTVSPMCVPQVDVRTNFVREEPLDLQCLPMNSAILCRGRRIHTSGHSDLGILSNLGRSAPSLPDCKQTLRRLLVLHKSQWHPSLLRPSFVTQTNLAQWRLQRLQSRLSQCHLGVRLDLYTSEFSAQTPHFLRWHMPISEAKWTLCLSLCVSKITPFFALDFFQAPCWKCLEFLPFCVHCGFCIRNFHRLWHWNKLVHQIVMWHRSKPFACNVIFMIFPDSEDSARCLCGLMRFHFFNHTLFWNSSRMQSPTSRMQSPIFATTFVMQGCLLHGMAGAVDLTSFLLAFFLKSFFEILVIRIDNVNSSQSPEHCRASVSLLPMPFCSRFWTASPILVRTSGHTWSGLVVVWIFVSPTPDHMYPFGGFSVNRVNFVKLLQRTLTKCCSNRHSSDRQSVSLVTHPDLIWVDLVASMYFSGIRNVFFLHDMELNSRFTVMKIDEVTLDRPEVDTGFSVHLWVLSVETLRLLTMMYSAEIFAPLRSVPASEWVLGIRGLFLTILPCAICNWEHEFVIFFVWSILLSRWFFEDKTSDASNFSKSFLIRYQNISFPNSSRDHLIAKKDSR